MPKERISLDYSKFIEKLTELDDDEDFCLTEEQFKTLLKDIPISERKDFVKITYTGLKDKKTGKVSFQNIRILYEATRVDFLNKPMLLILFRGAATKTDRKLSLDEYLTVARLSQTIFNEKDIRNKFNECDEDGSGRISYPDVAQTLFNIRTKANENPFKEQLEFRSPHSGCCRI